MIIKITKPGFIPASKDVRFGYDDESYFDLFGKTVHTVHFYSAGKKNEYLICLNAVLRDNRIGSLMVLDLKKSGNQKLIKQALGIDYNLEDSDYEIVFA